MRHPLGNARRGEDFQHGRTDGGGDERRVADFGGDDGFVAGVDTAHVFDGFFLVNAFADDVHGVAVVLIQAVNDGHVDVGEDDFVTGFGQDFADEATADVAAAEV